MLCFVLNTIILSTGDIGMLIEYGNTVVDYSWQIDEKIPPGYSRVYYVYDGEVEYKDEMQKTDLKHGYLYIFPSASTYQMKQNPQSRLYCTYFHLDVFPALITELVEIPVENNAALKYILLAIAASIDAQDVKLTYVLADVFETYCEEHKLINYPEQQLSKVLFYIAEHIKENITVQDLSSLSGYNEQYFIRLFKQTIGLTPYHYIVSFRLKEAKRLLRTDIPVTQVANMTGYNDVKSFSRAFKSNFGISPSGYRDTYTIQP